MNFNHFQNVNYLLNKRWSWKKKHEFKCFKQENQQILHFRWKFMLPLFNWLIFLWYLRVQMQNMQWNIANSKSKQHTKYKPFRIKRSIYKDMILEGGIIINENKKTTENNNNQKCSVKLMHTNWFPRFQMMCEFFAISYVLRVPDSCLAFKL